MKSIFKLLAALSLTALVLTVFATPVAATTVRQEQELEQKVECKTGSYGQSTICEVTQKGKQSQVVEIDGVRYFVRNDGRRVRIHTPVNTSINQTAIAGMVASALAATGAGVLLLKKQR